MDCASIHPSTSIDGRSLVMSEVREAVRSRYANAAKQLAVFNSLGSGPAGCCQADGPDCGCSGSYSADELKEIGLTESVSLGCGNPTMLAQLEPGQIVLDLGSGAGLDVLLSARRAPPGGHAYGGATNATFLKGDHRERPTSELIGGCGHLELRDQSGGGQGRRDQGSVSSS